MDGGWVGEVREGKRGRMGRGGSNDLHCIHD